MKIAQMFLAILFTCSAAAHAQAVPAATGPSSLSTSGNLHYTLRYSETAEYGDLVGDWQTAVVSADMDYANTKERHPFSLGYTGGYTWTITGPAYASGMFQRLRLAQGLLWRHWKITATDDVSYRPQAPTTGFSGIPGIGEPIGQPVTTPPSSQSILTVNTHVVDNRADLELEDTISHATSISASGSSELRRYPDGNAVDANDLQAKGTITRHLNARNSLSGTYSFSDFSYPDYKLAFTANSALFGFTREWNRKITTNLSVGPQWISSSKSAIVPSSTNLAVNANFDYQSRFTAVGLSYYRTANDGSGYLIGSQLDIVSATLSRSVGRELHVGLDTSYRRTAGLTSNGLTTSKCGGVQVTRRIGRFLSAYASYTAMDQSSSSILSTNALAGLMQVVGFGVGYSPRERHLKP